jgi:hypothetical protein
MQNLLIREVPDEVMAALAGQAERNRRSREKQALFLIERGLETGAAETCGELADRIWAEPAPDIDPKAIDSYLSSRKRRSNRP